MMKISILFYKLDGGFPRYTPKAKDPLLHPAVDISSVTPPT